MGGLAGYSSDYPQCMAQNGQNAFSTVMHAIKNTTMENKQSSNTTMRLGGLARVSLTHPSVVKQGNTSLSRFSLR